MQKYFVLVVLAAVTLFCGSVHGVLILDQSWEKPESPNWGCSISLLSPIGQEYTAGMDNIVGIELAISGDYRNMGGGDIADITVNLRNDSIGGAILGSGTVSPNVDQAFLDNLASGAGYVWLYFDLGGTVSLTPGNLYVIEASVPEVGALNWLWMGWSDPSLTELPGRPISNGDLPDGQVYSARGFSTYAVPEPATVFLLGLGLVMVRKRRKT